MDIETLGVNAVKEIMQFNPYIDTRYIKEGDKYPSFDGEILIYNNKAGKKNGLNRVNTQIKTQFSSSFENEISYMIECVDLENYMNLGGCLYFVVQYNNDTRQKVVYYTATTISRFSVSIDTILNVMNASPSYSSNSER